MKKRSPARRAKKTTPPMVAPTIGAMYLGFREEVTAEMKLVADAAEELGLDEINLRESTDIFTEIH